MYPTVNDIVKVKIFKESLEYCINEIILAMNATSMIVKKLEEKFPDNHSQFKEVFGKPLDKIASDIQGQHTYLSMVIENCKHIIEDLYKPFGEKGSLITRHQRSIPSGRQFQSLMSSIENSKDANEAIRMAAHYLSRSQRDCMNYINSTTSTWPSETKYLYSSQLEQIVDNTIGSTRNKLIFAGDTITKANPVQKVKVLKPTFNEKLSKEDAQLVVDSVLNLHKEIVGNFNLDYRAAFEFFTERMPELKNDNVNTVLANCFNHNSEYINSSLTDREKSQQMELLKKNSASNETYLKIISTLLTQDINSIKSLIGKLSKIGTPKAKALIDQDVQLLVDFSQLKQLLDATHHSLRTMNPDDVSTQ